MKRLDVLPLLRPAHRPQPPLDPDDDQGILLEDWPEVESVLCFALHNIRRLSTTERERSILLRCVLSADPRERGVSYQIAEYLVESGSITKYALLSILMEFLCGEIDHYGIDLVLALLSVSGIEPEDIEEIHIPMLSKKTNKRIREEIFLCLASFVDADNLEFLTSRIRKYIRGFGSRESATAIEIIRVALLKIDELDPSSALNVSKIFSFTLSGEHQAVLDGVASTLMDRSISNKFRPFSEPLISSLFPVVYNLSRAYWKKTEQAVACRLLHLLFEMNHKVFDRELRAYNRDRQLVIGVPTADPKTSSNENKYN